MVDFIEPATLVFSVIREIYSIVEQVQSFKHRSRTLHDRIQVLRPAIEKLAAGENDDIVGKAARDERGIKVFSSALGDLLILLQSIRDFLQTLKEKKFLTKLLHEKKIGNRFDEFSEQLDALVTGTHFSLQVEMREVMYDRLKQDKEDQRKDLQDLSDILETLDKIESGQEKHGELLEEIRAKLSAKSDSQLDRGRVDGVKEIGPGKLENKMKIDTGGFGTVYRARYMKEMVALKVFPTGVNVDKETLFKEAKNLICLNSDHVVRMWGVCTKAEPYIIVLEYMERGNLRYVLDNTEASELPCHKRIGMALGGAFGLYRIHHMPKEMLHLDLASHKFLVNGNWEVKISDVGLAKTRTSIRKHSKHPGYSASNIHYICPEALENINRAPDEPMEVYSYGIIMWEIATGLKPYKDMELKEIVKFVEEKKKLSFTPAVTNEGFKALIDKCLNFNPLERPTSGEIVDTLQGLRDALDASRGEAWV